MTKLTSSTISKICGMTAAQASKVGPFSNVRGDSPCVIRFVFGKGETEVWKSRYAAYYFYSCAASGCEGSEANRYAQIADYLAMGAVDIADDQDHPTLDQLRFICTDAKTRKMFAKDYEYARKHYKPIKISS